MTVKERAKQLKYYQFYFLVGLMSLVCLFVMPFMTSKIGLAWKIPDTTAGWFVFCTVNICTAVISVMIFHCFIKQGKVNIRDHPKYLEAQSILSMSKLVEHQPRCPKSFFRHQYSIKGMTIFISSLTAMVGLSNAILRFDLSTFLSFISVTINGVVFGIIEMNVVEDYWTDEYWMYAKKVEHDELKEDGRTEEEIDDILQKELDRLNDQIAEYKGQISKLQETVTKNEKIESEGLLDDYNS